MLDGQARMANKLYWLWLFIAAGWLVISWRTHRELRESIMELDDMRAHCVPCADGGK